MTYGALRTLKEQNAFNCAPPVVLRFDVSEGIVLFSVGVKRILCGVVQYGAGCSSVCLRQMCSYCRLVEFWL